MLYICQRKKERKLFSFRPIAHPSTHSPKRPFVPLQCLLLSVSIYLYYPVTMNTVPVPVYFSSHFSLSITSFVSHCQFLLLFVVFLPPSLSDPQAISG